MIVNITQDFQNNGRMYLLKHVRKSHKQINNEYDEDAKLYGDMFLTALYNLICINDIVIGLVTDAFSHVSKSPLYKHEVKNKMKVVKKQLELYERHINRLVAKYSENFANANDAFYTSDMADNIEKLRLLFKQELDKKKIEYSNELSWLEIARVMLEYSVACNKKREQEINQVTKRCNCYFSALDIKHIHLTYEQIFKYIRVGASFNLNTPQCVSMFKNIDRMCMEPQRLQNTINEMSQEV